MVYYIPKPEKAERNTKMKTTPITIYEGRADMKTITNLELYRALTRKDERRDRMGSIYAAAYAWSAFVALYGVARFVIGNI